MLFKFSSIIQKYLRRQCRYHFLEKDLADILNTKEICSETLGVPKGTKLQFLFLLFKRSNSYQKSKSNLLKNTKQKAVCKYIHCRMTNKLSKLGG